MSETSDNPPCERCVELEKENAELRARLAAVEGRVEELERTGKRQAAPFRIADDKRKTDPKPPGRKPGHPGSYRTQPLRVDEEIDVPLAPCPRCGGPALDVCRVEQYIEELPEPVEPRVTRLITYRGRCRRCGETLQSRHPLQVSQATGAARTQLGPRALALAAELRYNLGLTVRKVCRVLRRGFGLEVTPGGLTQALARVARRLEGTYEALVPRLRASGSVYADETSWWVGGPGHWLWVFTTPQLTVYKIEARRGQAVVDEVLGEAFQGVLVSDCLSSYDPIACKKQKCYAHHLRAVARGVELRPDSRWLKRVRLVLHTAMTLGELREGLLDYEKFRQGLEDTADTLLAHARDDPEEERVANRLRKQRPHLFRFLHEDGVEPTNNRAERQLRPAVIARKLSCGNKTQRGKRSAEILMSLAASARQQGQSLDRLVRAAFVGLDPTLLLFPNPAR